MSSEGYSPKLPKTLYSFLGTNIVFFILLFWSIIWLNQRCRVGLGKPGTYQSCWSPIWFHHRHWCCKFCQNITTEIHFNTLSHWFHFITSYYKLGTLSHWLVIFIYNLKILYINFYACLMMCNVGMWDNYSNAKTEH